MKALVYDGVETLNYRDMADPVVATGEHLVKIAAVGICGSDMHAYLGHDARRPAPLILGHEAAGVIVGGPRNGTRVTINPLVTSDDCPACREGRENICPDRQIISMPPREGAFAEYVAIPERNLVTVPDAVPLEKACLAEPLAVSWHAMRLGLESMATTRCDRLLVIGGGAIGVAAALAAKAMGMHDITVTDPNAARVAFLRGQMGLNAHTAAQGDGYDMVVDAVGYAATREAASALVRPGGTIVHIGLGDGAGGLDIRRMTLQEITFIGTYTYTMQDFRDTAQAIFDGRLGDLGWTQERPLSAGAQAFADLRSGAVDHPKIVLRP